MREAMRLLSAESGRDLSPWYVTPVVVKGAASVLERLAGMAGRVPPFCREAARVMLHGHRYDGTKAQRELGLTYTPISDTIRRTLDWFEDEGLLMGRT